MEAELKMRVGGGGPPILTSERLKFIPLKDAQKTRLFSGGENHDFLLSDYVFGAVFCQYFQCFLAAN